MKPPVERRRDQLGMPMGTAAHRLRKMIMFDLIQKTNQDFCFVCDERIETPEELSIEHKRPWLDIDPALFWDLDNIAFSHRNCNKPHRPNGGTNKNKTSKYRGVMWEEARDRGFKRNKWRACIWHEGKTIHIGYFDGEEVAAQAYDKKAKELKGKKARLNFG